MARRIQLISAGMAVASLGLGGCATGESDAADAFIDQRVEQTASGYPDLRDVPTANLANTDPRHWATVTQETLAAAAEMKAHPRAEFGTPEDPDAFLDEARDDLEETRDSH